MRMLKTAIAAFAALMSISGCTHQKTGLAAVADAMGATNLNSIEYSGSGELFGFGQAFIPGERWPRFVQPSYDIAVNYQTPAMRMNTVRSQGEYPPRGGAAQPVGQDQRAIQVTRRGAAPRNLSARINARSRSSAANMPGPKAAPNR